MDDIVMVWLIFHSWLSDAHQDVHKGAHKLDLPSPGNNNNAPLTLRERHHVYYRFIVLTKEDTFPPFSAVGIYDDKQFAHYCNKVENWKRVNLTEYDGIEPLPEPNESKDWYEKLLKTLSNCAILQCSELHVLQRIIGCELEKLPDGTIKSLTAYDEYGFDGEDFISFNSDTVKWIDKNPKAKKTKEDWDLQTEHNQFTKDYLNTCINWMSIFNNTNMSRPDVHVSARKSADDHSKLVLTCLATDFYPRDVQMNIRLNKTKLNHQTSSEIRPNEDETFQMRISVKIDRNHEGSYDCLVIHSSLTVSVEWDGKCSNCESEPRRHVGAEIAAVLALVLMIVIGCMIYKSRRSNGDEDTTAAANEAKTSSSLAKKHFLHYKFTVLTKADTFPEFSAVVVADGRRIKHFSNEERVWILTEDDWTEAPDPPDSRNRFIHQIRTLTNCENSQCSELHVLQRIIGCELEKLPDGTVNLTVFDEYGFDGEDFISFNSDTVQWIDKNPKAKETKMKWDLQTERNQYIKYFLKNCMNWISTFNNTEKTAPDVHVFAREYDQYSQVLTCLATGFYPRDVQMYIRLYKYNLRHQTSSGIRPNDDETFQMRISVKIDRNEGSYDCHVIHSSLTVTAEWDRKCSNCEPEPRWDVGAVAGVVLTVLAVIVTVICFICRRRRPNSLMTWRHNYGSVENQSQNDQSEDKL